MAQKFQYYQDQKMTIWYRAYFEVEAASKEEADEYVKNNLRTRDVTGLDDEKPAEFLTGEFMEDTSNLVYPANNDGMPTLEIYSGEGDMRDICTNID